ncbi:MAG: rod shape-determining protein RodA [Sporichthyaceae bacterium]
MTLTSWPAPNAAAWRAHPPTLLGAPRSKGRGADPLLIGAVLMLCGFGTLLVYSATRPRLIAAGSDPEYLMYRHVISIVLGLVLALAIAGVDYRRLRVLAPLAYLAAIAGLVLVLSPLGATINGSHSWIMVGAFSAQPVEFAKLALVLGLAVLLAERREGTAELACSGPGRGREVPATLLLAAIPIVLVALQPDAGSLMVLLAVLCGVLVVAAVPLRVLAALLATAVLGAIVVWQAGLLGDYQLARFAAFANPALDPAGVGYNVNQARIAVGSGGLTGTGLFQGTQTGGQFVPEQHTDFIVTVAGEETGLLGTGALILMFALVIWRGGAIARGAPDLFGTLLCAGIVSWFAFQAFQNIGMALGLMPITGLPLPFVSYGGTAMLANLMAVGLLLNVHRARKGGSSG